MKINIKHKLSFGEADKLIEKYYDGLTTVDEEKQLQNFLMQANLPERYKAEQAILGYFDQKKKKRHFGIQPYIRWASAAAIIVTVMFSVQFFIEGNQSNYAYIDGKKITDVEQVRGFAENSLKSISDDEALNETYNMDSKEIMKQQLGAFSK